jgi:hypothetical protein
MLGNFVHVAHPAKIAVVSSMPIQQAIGPEYGGFQRTASGLCLAQTRSGEYRVHHPPIDAKSVIIHARFVVKGLSPNEQPFYYLKPICRGVCTAGSSLFSCLSKTAKKFSIRL